ncbi:NmrA family NAD(P)-binding protein [Streptomyces sp. NPDC051776]|uniref:SDR family oxidoreductase n=1 Tax=Streptomyces sp. NPDC051776 TaxID=3155414 RepID=UPI00343E294F
MSYVIHGATGAQGKPVLTKLEAAGKQVVGLARKHGTSDHGTPIVAARYSSVQELTAAYEGADGVFVHLPIGAEEDRVTYAHNIAAALRAAQPRRVVVSTSGVVVDRPSSPLQAPVEAAVPTLIRGLEQAGLSYAVIAPRLFLENLLAPSVLDAVRTDGVLRYPLRADFPVSWSSHLDNADVATALFDRTDITGTIAVGQYPGLTGPDLAEAFTAHLGRTVSYEPSTPEVFGELLAPAIGAAGAAGVVALYQWLATVRDNTITIDNSAQQKLGLKPRTTTEWLEQIGW